MISARNIECRAGVFRLNASLEVKDNEYFVLLGMTGSGKTMLIESICGLRKMAGAVAIGGRDVTELEPHERMVGYVPQDGALFPHLSVRENIGFSLAVKGVFPVERSKRVEEVAGMLGITKLLDRGIPGLSGGERQRVALARALVSKPSALLLDEPVSALDEHTRDVVCRELVRLQRAFAVPVIHVCHSTEEARMVADRIGVMGEGSIVQVGTPSELFGAPNTEYVARMLRLDNIFSGIGVRKNGIACIDMPGGICIAANVVEGPVDFLVKPWEVQIQNGGSARDFSVFSGKIGIVEDRGAITRVIIDEPLFLTVHLPREMAGRLKLTAGMTVGVRIPPEAVYVFPGTGRR